MVLAASGALYGLLSSPELGLREIDVRGDAYTAEEQVIAQLGMSGANRNVIGIPTDELADRVLALTSVVEARVEVILPGTLRVQLLEREPVLVWAVGGARLLVDRDGFAFLDAASSSATSSARTVARQLPLVEDRRGRRQPLPGESIDSYDFDAATRFASLTPAQLGSGGSSLRIVIDDEQGFTVSVLPEGWTAVFGFYTANLRSPELIAGQVRLLRSLLVGREGRLARILLADDRNGTYTTR